MTARTPSSAMALAARVASASRAMARITGVLIILIMIAVVIDAVLRGMMGIAIWGVLEVGVLLLLALIYLGLPATQANRENFRVSIFAERFPPWVDRIVTWLLLAVQLAVLGILCWTSWRSSIYSFNRDEVSFGMVQIPLWPSRAMVSVGLTLLLIQSITAALEYALVGRHPYQVDIETELKGEIGKTDNDLIGERK
ncbi:MAG: TRAP transporter small permease [Betaproteobacteria bacterium]|nr:TRAP transporter small permease [Betaproteobacteria bacterium]